MQKNFSYPVFGKTPAALVGIAALLLLFCASGMLQNRFLTTESTLSDSRGSLYKQLDNPSEVSQKAVESTQKMNNENFENANFSALPNESPRESLPTVSEIRVLDDGEVFTMSLEEYVVGAVLGEMPQSFERQALMAQAVACRTFAVRAAVKHDKHTDADVCTDYRCCQSFTDPKSVSYDRSAAESAVSATRGIIAVYDGEPILAAYHASSVIRTRSSAEVWGGALDYLVPVAAVESKESAAETVRISSEHLKAAIKKQKAFNGEKLCFSFDAQGLCIGASDGKTAVTVRELQRAAGLRSETFSVVSDGDDYIFTCYGYGHGVGMSQYGANTLAESGYDFYEILKYYYSGIGFGFCL